MIQLTNQGSLKSPKFQNTKLAAFLNIPLLNTPPISISTAVYEIYYRLFCLSLNPKN